MAALRWGAAMPEYWSVNLALSIFGGVVSGLFVALIVARVRFFRPPPTTAAPPKGKPAQSAERVRVSIRVETKVSSTKSSKSSSDTDDGDNLVMFLILGVLATGVFARFVGPLVEVLLLASVALGAAVITAVVLLVLSRVRLAPGAWLLLLTGATGAAVGAVSAVLLAVASADLVDLKTLDDWLGSAYLALGLGVAFMLVIASIWAMLVILANAGLALNAPGRGLWDLVTRKAPPTWWYVLVAVTLGAAAVALSSGWAYGFVTSHAQLPES